MKKIILTILTVAMTAVLFAGCGAGADGAKEANLTGSCEEILTQVYETATLSEDMQNAKGGFQTTTIDETMEEYILGTTEIDYSDAVLSAPMINVVPYQCVILRTAEGQDVEAAKEALMQNADPRKWICVEAESVVVENVGDVILFVMADQVTADAMKAAFLALDAE